ncbi:MAG: hypothetical protein PHF97_01605 [Bacteroidales bacterium]|nr:hypothetical protein [Bacteroidales bacterium]
MPGLCDITLKQSVSTQNGEGQITARVVDNGPEISIAGKKIGPFSYEVGKNENGTKTNMYIKDQTPLGNVAVGFDKGLSLTGSSTCGKTSVNYNMTITPSTDNFLIFGVPIPMLLLIPIGP